MPILSLNVIFSFPEIDFCGLRSLLISIHSYFGDIIFADTHSILDDSILLERKEGQKTAAVKKGSKNIYSVGSK